MSLLIVYPAQPQRLDRGEPPEHAPAVGDQGASEGSGGQGVSTPPTLICSEAAQIQRELAVRGVHFERWPAAVHLTDGAGEAEILAAYADEIARVQAEGGYGTVDAIRLRPDHPERQALRQKFLAEHTHAEDEVRFFVEGRGLFCLHLGEEVLQLVCERNDWIRVPAGTRHWFDMGERPAFCALRFFNNSDGWVARFTGDAIAECFAGLDELLAAAP